MKLIDLNIWGGKIHQPLLEFLKLQMKDTDVFCFQEVYNSGVRLDLHGEIVADIYKQIAHVLEDHTGFYSEAVLTEEDGFLLPYGTALFVRKSIPILRQKTFEIFSPSDEPRLGIKEGFHLWNRLLQTVTIPFGDRELTVFNFHGLYTGWGKDDQPSRFEQSEKVRTIMKGMSGEKILCGDFNLNPETQSIKILEEGMRNLVKDYNITSTRSHYYAKETKFADYVLITDGIHIHKFVALDNVVSDHLPLLLIIE